MAILIAGADFQPIYTLTRSGRVCRTKGMASQASRSIRKVVVLGANGAMGAGGGEVFAAAGIPTVFLARSRDKAEKGKQRAEKMAKSEALGALVEVGSYDEDLARVLPGA